MTRRTDFICPGCGKWVQLDARGKVPWHLDAPLRGCRSVGYYVPMRRDGTPDTEAVRRFIS